MVRQLMQANYIAGLTPWRTRYIPRARAQATQELARRGGVFYCRSYRPTGSAPDHTRTPDRYGHGRRGIDISGWRTKAVRCTEVMNAEIVHERGERPSRRGSDRARAPLPPRLLHFVDSDDTHQYRYTMHLDSRFPFCKL